MNKIHQVFLLFAVAVTLFLVLKTIKTLTFKSDNAAEAQIIISTELDNISQTDIDGVIKEARKALKLIPPILGIKYDKTLEIKIVDKGRTCNAMGGTVTLLVAHVRNKSAPVIHEVTHAITMQENSSFFSEGLAVYFQERFGDAQVFPNFSIPVNDLIRRNKDQLIPITRLINDNEIFTQFDTEQRKLAYLTAGSFVSFLVEKYGEQKLADLNSSKTLNYERVYGKDISQLETEWKNHVFEEPHSI